MALIYFACLLVSVLWDKKDHERRKTWGRVRWVGLGGGVGKNWDYVELLLE